MDSGSLKIQYNRNRYYDYYTGLGSYFSSHPAFDLRIERVNRLLSSRSD
jgi:hypothetical protein